MRQRWTEIVDGNVHPGACSPARRSNRDGLMLDRSAVGQLSSSSSRTNGSDCRQAIHHAVYRLSTIAAILPNGPAYSTGELLNTPSSTCLNLVRQDTFVTVATVVRGCDVMSAVQSGLSCTDERTRTSTSRDAVRPQRLSTEDLTQDVRPDNSLRHKTHHVGSSNDQAAHHTHHSCHQQQGVARLRTSSPRQ